MKKLIQKYHLNKVLPFLCLVLMLMVYNRYVRSKQLVKTILEEKYQVEVRLHEGWNSDWVKPEFNDSNWKENLDKSKFRGVVRYKIKFDKDIQNIQEPAINLQRVNGSYHLYWDGVFIGKNGEPATQNNPERPSSLQKIIMIPDSLFSEGQHMLAFYLSNHHSRFERLILPSFKFGEYQELIRFPLILSSIMHVLAGIFLVVGGYYLLIYFISHRNKIHLIFGCLCLLFFSLIIFEYLKFSYRYPYPFHFWRLSMITFLTGIIALVLPFYFLIQFDWVEKWSVIFILILFEGIVLTYGKYHFDEMNIQFIGVGFLFTTYIVSKELYKKTQGSRLAFISILPLWVSFFLYYDLFLFISFAFLIGVNLYSLSLQSRQERKQKEEALLKASRLEVEILKRNIQPHFLLNTLTSLIDWVEESPEIGVQFIEELGQEYEILADISHKTLIPIEQEIKLCQHHLQVMKFRKDIHYELKVTNIDVAELIPPALFHTLIENGITHNIAMENHMNFYLTYEKNKTFQQYIFVAGGKIQEDENHRTAGSGTGLKYVKARLEESYPQRWTLTNQATEKGWETIIQIQNI